jgi:hypothetical protein
MTKSKKTDYWILFLWNIPAFFLAMHYGTNYLISAFLIAGIPAIYLTFRRPALFYKIGKVSLFLSVISVMIVSYLGHLDGSWYDPSQFARILGVYPVEDFVWGFMYFYYMLTFYEYFYEKEKKLILPKRFRKYVAGGLILTFLFSLIAYFKPSLFLIPYFYAFFLIICLFLTGCAFSKYPKLIIKILKTDLFFILPHFVGEYVAMTNHNWFFPGKHFIGYVSAAGITIPLEEFLWILVLVPTIIVFYEIIADDRI